MEEFFTEIFELPEFRLFLDYWYVWIPLLIMLIAINLFLIGLKCKK